MNSFDVPDVDPFELAAKLGVDITHCEGASTNKASRSKTNGAKTGAASIDGAVPDMEPIDWGSYPWIRKELDKVTGKDDGRDYDRSDDIWRIVATCMESGLTLANARWVINQRADLVEKLDELFPRDEVGICWEKGQDEQTLQMGNSTPDTGGSTSATNTTNASSSTSSSANSGNGGSTNAGGTAGKRSVASQLVDMARRGYTLGVSDDGTPYGTEPGRSHIALPLRGGKLGLRVALARRFYDTHHVVASSQALANACTVLEGYAAQMPPRPLHLRVAGHDDKVYIDTADANDRVIVIHGGTWSFASGGIPVMFRRTELTASMPDPLRGGDLGKLWEYVRIAEADRPILLAVLVAALIQPDVPHVILAFLAEHGCAKSSSARYVVSLIDPSAAPLQMPPRDVDGWVTTANGARVVALDNLSGIPDWLSDALCRAATGEGHTKRQLYTDADLTVIRFRRVIILNGIDLGGLRGDLTDRLAPVDLIRITDTDRRDEAELATAWEQDRPAILGGLLDLATQVHARLPTFPMDKLPRMADFARVLACIDDICGTQGVWQYGERAKHQAADGLEADPFIARLMAMNFTCTDESASVILARARRGLISSPQGWPQKARTATSRLSRAAPALRSLGWQIENDNGANKAHATHWTIAPPS